MISKKRGKKMDSDHKFEDQVSDMVSKISVNLKKGANVIGDFVSQKAEIVKIKMDLSQAQKEVNKAYEKLGRGIYAELVHQQPFLNKEDTLKKKKKKEDNLIAIENELKNKKIY